MFDFRRRNTTHVMQYSVKWSGFLLLTLLPQDLHFVL
jgi:hypothetical protein